MAKRKGLSKKTRFEVFKRDSFTCQYCGQAAPTVVLHADHIQPVSKEGENDLLNLITSCVECNQGKSNRLLSDDTAITRQKAQLDELQERREQLEMMIEWRTGLADLDTIAYVAAESEWERLTGWGLSEHGSLDLKKLMQKWGLNALLEAMPRAIVYLEAENPDRCTAESFNQAFNKLGGICKMMSLPDWKQELYHVRNIARKRSGGHWQNSTLALLMGHLEDAYNAGVEIEVLKTIASRGLNFNQLWDAIAEVSEGVQVG